MDNEEFEKHNNLRMFQNILNNELRKTILKTIQ